MYMMTDHSIGEADEGSVGVDGEVGEDRAQGEREASKQETTSTEEDWSSISPLSYFYTCPGWG